MKIIDLLVKTSESEDPPKKIKYKNHIWYYDKMTQDYCRNDTDGLYVYLFQNLFQSETDIFINDEIEIIEEPKKIEKITIREKTLGFPNGEWVPRNMDKAFAIKINELIDEINKMKEGK